MAGLPLHYGLAAYAQTPAPPVPQDDHDAAVRIIGVGAVIGLLAVWGLIRRGRAEEQIWDDFFERRRERRERARERTRTRRRTRRRH